MDLDDGSYKILLTGLVISILLSGAYVAFLRSQVMRDEVFNELYFPGGKVPEKTLMVNKTYEVNFAFSNRHYSEKKYFLEIDTPSNRIIENYTIGPDSKMEMAIKMTPLEPSWGLSYAINIVNFTSVPVKSGKIGVFSTDIGGYGRILHHNLSFEQLRETPFTRSEIQVYRTKYHDPLRIFNFSGEEIPEQDLEDEIIKMLSSNYSGSLDYGSIETLFEQIIERNKSYAWLKDPRKSIYEKITAIKKEKFDSKTVNNTLTVKVRDNLLITQTTSKINNYQIIEKPVIIKLYENDMAKGDELQIHYWVKII